MLEESSWENRIDFLKKRVYNGHKPQKGAKEMVYYAMHPSPLGELLLTADDSGITGLWMDRDPPAGAISGGVVLAQARSWLDDYFGGNVREVDFPLNPAGTAFQRRVWALLRAIPAGESVTYGSLAKDLGEKLSPQAIGGAVGRNPISILIPCHRVLEAGGRLTGYAGGMDRKRWLLEHEGIGYRE